MYRLRLDNWIVECETPEEVAKLIGCVECRRPVEATAYASSEPVNSHTPIPDPRRKKLSPEQEAARARRERIYQLIFERGTINRVELRQLLREESPITIDKSIGTLKAEGRIEAINGSYRPRIGEPTVALNEKALPS